MYLEKLTLINYKNFKNFETQFDQEINCIIGANSLITERKEFADNSLIMGSPAKVIRELTEEEISVLVLSAKHYIDKSKIYKAELQS